MQLWDNPYQYSDMMAEETINSESQYLLHDIYNQNHINEYKKYKEHILAKNYFNPEGLHGIKHTERVLFHCINLANINKLNHEQKNVLYFAAIYHDIGRDSDGKDIMHGCKSYAKLEKMNLLGFLDSDEKRVIKYIIENHCIEDTDRIENKSSLENNYLLDLLKDADALDRVRISDLNKEYLRNAHSKKMIHIAWRLFNTKSFI